jgi:flagellar basal body rod protein FlgG
MSDSILQAGLQGVHSGIDQFGRASGQIATASNSSSSTTNNSIVDNLVDVKQAQRTVETSVAVIKVADEVLGSLLNELA